MATQFDGWAATLDEIERGADACIARFVHGDDIELTMPEPPRDLGALPAELEGRAMAVLARVREAEALLARIPRPELSVRPPRSFARPAASSTFEHQA
ncbi:MAG TPA: hypothetical protein VF183_04940 [Acidimicrobiales bacterium]